MVVSLKLVVGFRCSFVVESSLFIIWVIISLDQVSGQVFREIIGSSKCLTAGVAAVRPFARVNPQVTVHVTLAAKGSAAEFALERTLAGVLADVELQVLFSPEAFAAERAQVRAAWIVFGRRSRNSGTCRRIDQRRSAGGRRGRYRCRSCCRRRRRTEITDEIVQERSGRIGCCRRWRCGPPRCRAFTRLTIVRAFSIRLAFF